MSIQPVVSKITIYPVKSLDGTALQKATITEGGCLLHDREFAIIDEEGNFINGKSNPLVHTLRSTVDFENETISFRPMKQTEWMQFHLQENKPAINSWLSDYFGIKATLVQNKTGRFMDIPDISSVTVLSSSSLQEVTGWFDHMNLEETRKRFRATIEIEGVPAFWEDHLFSEEGKGIEFTAGDVTLFGMSPRARCVVPTRHPHTGEVIHAFPKSFAKHRAATVPAWSTLKNYGHYYYLTVNCYVPATEIGKIVEVGDEIKIIGEKLFY
jgi:uncharacterized protein YcbX